jgi:hypothetical protein
MNAITIEHGDGCVSEIRKVNGGAVRCEDCGTTTTAGYAVGHTWPVARVTAAGIVMDTMAAYGHYGCKTCTTTTITMLARVADLCFIGNTAVQRDHVALAFHNAR